jgi:hypothetical protein
MHATCLSRKLCELKFQKGYPYRRLIRLLQIRIVLQGLGSHRSYALTKSTKILHVLFIIKKISLLFQEFVLEFSHYMFKQFILLSHALL